jgi:DNA polymerase-3 subunit delta
MDSPHSSDKPVVILLRGDDPFAMQRIVDDLRARVSDDPSMADLNTTRLDGRTASDEEIRTATDSLPFLANRRLVVLAHPFVRLAPEAARQRFLSLLEKLPETTGLALLVEDRLTGKSWETLKPDHWLIKWLAQTKRPNLIRECLLPRQSDMPNWVRKEAEKQGGQFTHQAAMALANHTGSDTALASQEITKLLTYVDFKRPVEVEDVEELSAAGGQVDVYKMVDAIATGDSNTALRMLHGLLEEKDAITLFNRMVDHFRKLLQTREILDEGGGVLQVIQDVEQRKWLAPKLVDQARRFSMAELETIYRRLVKMDEDTKTSQMPLDLAMDTLIAELGLYSSGNPGY